MTRITAHLHLIEIVPFVCHPPFHFSADRMPFHCQGPSRQIIAGLQRAGVEAFLHARSHVRPSCAPSLEMEFSLCANGGAHHARDKRKETLWDFVRFLTPCCSHRFRTALREKRQLALCLAHESARPQHYHRGSNCTLFTSTALSQSLA